LFVNPSVSWNCHIYSIDADDEVWHEIEFVHGAVESFERGIFIELNVKVIFEIFCESVEISGWHDDVAGARVDDDLFRKSVQTCCFNIFANFEFVKTFS